MPGRRPLTSETGAPVSAPGLALEGGRGARRTRRRAASAPTPTRSDAQADLFADPQPGAPLDVVPGDIPGVERQMEESPAFDVTPQMRYLVPAEAPLAGVPLASIGPASRPDGYLYLMADADTAAAWRESGLPVDARQPVVLAERPALLPWIAMVAEAAEDATPPVVLKLRRMLVDGMLEPDPDHTARLGAPCYLLTGAGSPVDAL